jgi:hypothetical protein
MRQRTLKNGLNPKLLGGHMTKVLYIYIYIYIYIIVNIFGVDIGDKSIFSRFILLSCMFPLSYLYVLSNYLALPNKNK